MKRPLCWLCILLLWSSAAHAQVFTISDIRLQGLQRVSAGTVFNILPVNVGDTVDEVAIRQLIRTLFNSGFFSDVRMARDDDVLVITLAERPAIESIEIDGNKAIKTDALLEGLGQQGLREGEIFKQATLERVGIELERQYVAQGRYGASITTSVEELPRNRVAIKIDVVEGKTSGIRHINIVGAQVFDQEELLEQLELQHPSLLSFYRNDDKYAREKLAGDLERLESYYKDRGYVAFDIESTQVSITPDRRQVYITVSVNEGEKYTVNKVNLIGELNDIRPEDLRRLFLVGPEQVFSQARVTATEERITQALGNSGLHIRHGQRGTQDQRRRYRGRGVLRRCRQSRLRTPGDFAGNTVTQDDVLRREMRQMEGGWASTAQIDLSKVRLERLGYFREVNVETPAVPGTDDQIDVNFDVEEQPSSSISATSGLFSGLRPDRRWQLPGQQRTRHRQQPGRRALLFPVPAVCELQLFRPLFTLDGISRGFNVFFRESNFDQANIARFTTNSFGGGVNFGFPIGETRRINFGASVEYTDITEGSFPAQEISEFIQKNGNDSSELQDESVLEQLHAESRLVPHPRAFPVLSLEAAVPGSDLQFYKLVYQGQMYIPLALHGRCGCEPSWATGMDMAVRTGCHSMSTSSPAASVRFGASKPIPWARAAPIRSSISMATGYRIRYSGAIRRRSGATCSRKPVQS
jgi:outer membrane protein insertion porin family